MNLPMFGATDGPLLLENIPALQDEVRALAAERGAVILAHNYQLPEIQDVADFVGDSLGLSRQAAAADSDLIVFCGVHFMAETASVLSPDKTRPDPRPRRRLLARRLDHGRRSCATGRPTHPPARSSSCTSTPPPRSRPRPTTAARRRTRSQVVEHILREHGPDTEILFGPDMFLGAYVEKTIGRADARLGRRVPRSRRDQAGRHQPPCAPRTPAPSS